MENKTTFSTNEEAVVREYGNSTVVKVTKVTPKTVFVGNRQFRVSKYGVDWEELNVGDRYNAPHGKLYKLTEKTREWVEETNENYAKAQEAKQIKADLEASDKAEMDAFFETEEGKLFREREENWKDSFIDTRFSFDSTSRYACVEIFKYSKKYSTADVRVYQTTTWNVGGDTRKYILKPVDIRLSGYTLNPSTARKYAEAVEVAAKIAESWDKNTGKVWNGTAQTVED
jgi:hypothetical protein